MDLGLFKQYDQEHESSSDWKIMGNITANDLKTKGIAAIEAALAEQPEAIVSVRGKERFVVMDLNHYHLSSRVRIRSCAGRNTPRHRSRSVCD
jgi:hypothetical protein